MSRATAQGAWRARSLLATLAVLPTAACAQHEAPPAPSPLTSEQQAFAAGPDLSAANVEFDRPGTGFLQWLSPDAPAMSDVSDGWLTGLARDPFAGWYSDGSGPFLYATIAGDFMIETRVSANRRGNPNQMPTARFTSAGLLIRDPESAPERMRWVMYNIGFQDRFFGTEAKTTRDADGRWHLHRFAGFRSLSTLFLTERPGVTPEAWLRMCRIGPEIRMFWRRAADGPWIEESRDATTQVQGNGASDPTPGVTDGGHIRMIRPDLPDTVQAGIIVNRGGSSDRQADGEGRFDYVRYSRVADFADCLR